MNRSSFRCQRTVRSRQLAVLATGALFAAFALPIHAATYTWANSTTTGTDWNTSGDWTTTLTPGFPSAAADLATFTGAEVTNPNLSGSVSIAEVLFTTTASSGYTISSSSSAVTLTLNGVSNAVINASNTTGTNTISAPIILGTGATKTITQAGAGTLAISGNISETTTGTSLALGGGSSDVFVLSGNNSYSGTTSITNSNETLSLGSSTAIGTSALTSNNNNFTLSNSSGSALTIANALNLGSTAGSGINFSGPNSLSIGGTVTLSGGVSSGVSTGLQTIETTVNTTLTFAGTVTGTGKGFQKNGIGTLVLSGTNSYTGATSVTYTNVTGNVGLSTLQFAKEVSLYGGNTASWTAQNIVVNSSAASTDGTVLAFNVGGTGEFTSSDIDTLKTLYAASGSGVNGGVGGFQTGTSLGLDTTNAAGGNFTYSTPITNLNSNAVTIGLVKLGTNTLTLSGTSTYTGGTIVNGGTLSLAKAGTAGTPGAGTLGTTAITVNTGGTLQVAASNAISTNNAVTLAGGTYGVSGSFSEGTAAHTVGATYNSSTRIATGGTVTGTNVQGVGILTLTTSASTLNFGSSVSTQAFGGFTDTSSLTLNILNYSSTANVAAGTSGTDGTDDRLIFNVTGGLSATQLADITFNGVADAAEINLGGNVYEVDPLMTAVPEPGTWAMMVLVSGYAGYVLLRRRQAKA